MNKTKILQISRPSDSNITISSENGLDGDFAYLNHDDLSVYSVPKNVKNYS